MLFQAQFALAAGRSLPVIYRAKSTSTGSTSTAPKPAGIAVGDTVVVVAVQTIGASLTTSSGSAWTSTSFNNTTGARTYAVYSKTLNATDVANAWNFSGAVGGCFSIAYDARGTGAVAQKESEVNTVAATTVVLNGYSPAWNHKGAFTVMVDETTTATDTTPTNFTSREAGNYGSGPTVRVSFADRIDGNYSGSVTWTNTGAVSDGTTECAALYEITGV